MIHEDCLWDNNARLHRADSLCSSGKWTDQRLYAAQDCQHTAQLSLNSFQPYGMQDKSERVERTRIEHHVR
jgi:hypothetical protein